MVINCLGRRCKQLLNRAKKSSLFIDSAWALTGNAIGRGLSLLSGMAVARFLGSSAFGEYGLIKSTLLTIATFSAFGLGYTVTKFIAENKNKSEEFTYTIHVAATSLTFVFSLIIAVFTAVFSNSIAIWLEAPNMGLELRLMAVAIVLNALITTQSGELAGFRAYKKIARNNTYYGIFTFVSSVPLSYYYGITGALVALLFSLAFNCIINYFTLHSYFFNNRTPKIDFLAIRQLLVFSLPIALQEVLFSVSSWVGSVMIIFLAGYSELGLYSAASQWFAVILFVPGALRNVALSHIAENNDNDENAQRIVSRLMRFNFLSTIIPFIIITLLSGFIANCYGKSFSALPPVLSVMTLYAVISSMIGVQKQDLLAHGYNWFLFTTNVAYYIFSIGCTYFMIKRWGNAALMYSFAGCAFSLIYLIVINAKRQCIYKHKMQKQNI